MIMRRAPKTSNIKVGISFPDTISPDAVEGLLTLALLVAVGDGDGDGLGVLVGAGVATAAESVAVKLGEVALKLTVKLRVAVCLTPSIVAVAVKVWLPVVSLVSGVYVQIPLGSVVAVLVWVVLPLRERVTRVPAGAAPFSWGLFTVINSPSVAG